MFSIPTDRLHKFAAIAGLAIATAGTTFGYSTYVERIAHLNKIEDQVRAAKKEHDLLLLQQFDAATDPYVERCATMHPKDETRRTQCQIEGAEKALTRLKEAERGQDAYNRLRVEEQAGTSQRFATYDHYRTRMWLAICIAAIGSLISLGGFWAWTRAERAPKAEKWPKIGDA